MKFALGFKKKLVLGFGLLLLLSLAIGGAGFRATYSMSDAADALMANGKIQNLNMEMEWALSARSDAVRGYLLTRDTAWQNTVEEMNRHFDESAGQLTPLLVTSHDRDLLAAVRAGQQATSAAYEQAIGLAHSGKVDEAVRLAFNPETLSARERMMQAMEELDAAQDRAVAQAAADHDRAESQGRMLILVVCLASIAFGLGAAWWIGKSITGRVQDVVVSLQAIDANDLTIADVEVGVEDEFGTAARALNSMKNNLYQVVHSIAETAENLAASSHRIHDSSGRAVGGADTQKSQVQQVATAMAEMSATVHEISESSNQAAQAARQASETAHSGGEIVQDALRQMHGIAQAVHETSAKVTELGARSDRIGQIVSVIDEIAGQTNLLALNAAIEAARAGEQGRGFAVVAGEVRRLAERTGAATREINEMIEGVQSETRVVVDTMRTGTEQVERGVEVTTRAGDSLQQIIGQAATVGEMVSQIATAATEQSAATEEVSVSMTRINELVGGSSEEARASAKICEELTAMAVELQRIVGGFCLAQERMEPTRASQPKVPLRRALKAVS